MTDMSAVIVPKSDQINADDLIAGPVTITIRDVKINGGQEQPVSIFFDGSDKAFRPCKSMSRVLVACWGADAKNYVGRSLTLYRDPTVKWGGLEVGGIRISHMSDIGRPMTMALTATKGSRKPFTVTPLTTPKPRQPVQRQSRASPAISEICALTSPQEMRAWWQNNNEAIPDDLYEEVLSAFEAHRASLKQATPSAASADPTTGAAVPATTSPDDAGGDDRAEAE